MPSSVMSRELYAASLHVQDAGVALRAAIGTARVELDDQSLLSEETWNLLDVLTDQLEARFGELERIERAEGLR